MDRKKLIIALEEAERFMDRAKQYIYNVENEETRVSSAKGKGEKFVYARDFPALTGAVRRASMDLTRALSDLRKPQS